LLLFQAPGSDSELDGIIEEKKPVVFVGRVPSKIRADTVATDIEAGTFMGVEYLLRKGRRRIGLLTQRDSLSVREFRLKGWRRAHAEAGLTPATNLHADSEISSEAGFVATRQLLSSKTLPDAIFADNLVLTIGVVRALQERGIAGSIEVVSSDEAEWLDVFHIPISTVVQPSYEVGVTAARLFLDRVTDPERPVETVLLKPALKIREGTHSTCQ